MNIKTIKKADDYVTCLVVGRSLVTRLTRMQCRIQVFFAAFRPQMRPDVWLSVLVYTPQFLASSQQEDRGSIARAHSMNELIDCSMPPCLLPFAYIVRSTTTTMINIISGSRRQIFAFAILNADKIRFFVQLQTIGMQNFGLFAAPMASRVSGFS